MPIISVFYGMTIKVYQGDHNPPHVHVSYGEYSALVDIHSGKLLAGSLPPRSLKMLREWLKANQAEILKAWDSACQFKTPKKVRPLA